MPTHRPNDEKVVRVLYIVLGALAGLLGFLPVFGSVRLARHSESTKGLTVGLYGLAGACISLVILVVALTACAMLARDSLVPFVVAEGVVFLAATIIYVVYKNLLAKRKAPKDAQ